MESKTEIIKEMIDTRIKDREKPYKVMFSITIPKYKQGNDIYEDSTLIKVEKMFAKYGIDLNRVDTKPGFYNLNREWLETTTDVECYVEYCGVYPIHWDIKDVVELERMDTDGEIIICVDWNVNGNYIPNN